MDLCLQLKWLPHQEHARQVLVRQRHKEAVFPPLSLPPKSRFLSQAGSMCPSPVDQNLDYQGQKYICPEESSCHFLKPSWGFWASGWPQQEQGKVFHKTMKWTTARYNECICAAWKSPNATFQWYLDKRPFQQQKVPCFLFAFLSTVSHLLIEKSVSHKLSSWSFPPMNFSKLN